MTGAVALDTISVRASITQQPGQMSIPVRDIRSLPMLLGESDIIKYLQLLPGVKMGTEGFSSFHVRGGGADQNLILLDEATVYNANHLFGLFSSFNSDALRQGAFWKGGFPSRYGGRLSSVVDLQMKEGNREKIRGEGGIGLISSRLTLEGPLKKNKSSFLVAGRRTYLDLFLKPFSKGPERVSYNFYDLNMKINWDGKTKDSRFYLSGYLSQDKLSDRIRLDRQTSSRKIDQAIRWKNATASFRWHRSWNPKFFTSGSLSYSHYNFLLSDRSELNTSLNTVNRYAANSSVIQDATAKIEGDLFISNQYAIKTGLYITNQRFSPGAYKFEDYNADIAQKHQEVYHHQQFGAFVENNWKLPHRWSGNFGIRLVGLRTRQTTHFFTEPRALIGFSVSEDTEITVSYSRMNQFLHQLSNTGTGLITDLWVPITEAAPAQQADQISGAVRKKIGKDWYLTAEAFRKWMRGIVAYKEGATFLVLTDGPRELDWQANITTGAGWAYGSEWLLEKKNGAVTGWIGYTLSWVINQFDEINSGKRFFPGHDRRHYLTWVMMYKFSEKVKLSTSWTYASGNRTTVPLAYTYGIGGYDKISSIGSPARIPYLGSRNSFQAEDFHRLDLGIQFLKKKKWGERCWEVGLYNAYFRKNPTYYYTAGTGASSTQRVELKKRSLFLVVPSISYLFRF